MSIVTTFAPEMARSIQRRDRAGFIDRVSLGARLVLLLTVPAAAGMFVLRRPLIGLALERGNFDATDAARTSAALAGFSLGLIGFSLYLFILRAFYAHEDARTPFVINVFENLINIVVAVVLVGRYGVLGLAASFAIAYTISSVFSLAVLSYKVRGFTMRSVLSPLARMLLAGVVMAEVMWVVARLVGDDEGWGALVRLTTAGVAGVTVYVVLLTVMQVPELQQLRTRLMSRFTTAPAVAADQPD
jgi:putative peptidoglycan lipid II flippase